MNSLAEIEKEEIVECGFMRIRLNLHLFNEIIKSIEIFEETLREPNTTSKIRKQKNIHWPINYYSTINRNITSCHIYF